MRYRAFFTDDHSQLIFDNVSAENIRPNLPIGCRVCPDVSNTIGRVDGGDEYKFALFTWRDRRILVIPVPKPGRPCDT